MQRLKAEEHVYLTGTVVKSLVQNRITTILDFLQEDAEKLSNLTKLSLPQVLAIRNDILNKYAAPVVNVGSLKIDNILQKKCLITSILSLDVATGGGLPIGYITELCGLADSGKTQVCLQVAMNCVKNTDNSVLYIDTKGDFSAERVQKILDVSGYSHKEMALMMFKIKIIHIWSMEELVELFKKLKSGMLHIDNLAIIIIDSLPCLMFQFLGDDNNVGLSFLNTFVNYARYIGKHLDLCVVCVNIQTRWIDTENSGIEDNEDHATSYGKESLHTEKKNRCLGKYWQHIPMMVMFIERESDRRSGENSDTYLNITVLDNSRMVQSNVCRVTLNNLGIT